MLVLSRKVGESVVIDGKIIVKVVRVEGDMVRIGISAPSSVPVHRQEVYDEIQKNNREAAVRERAPLPRLNRPAAAPRISAKDSNDMEVSTSTAAP
jgi:carbon storage regulator